MSDRDFGTAGLLSQEEKGPHAVGGMSFGTPTVAVNGTVVDIGAPHWLDQLAIDSQLVQ